MSEGLILVVLFGILLSVIFLGSPICSSLGFTALIGMLIWLGTNQLQQFGVIAYSQGTNYNQIIAPMFIMMSEFLSQGHIAEDIYSVLNRVTGKVKGGLAISTTLACTIFAALCGSSPATAASIGRISIFQMIKHGYSPKFAVGTVAAGGTLGIMIPPSITFVVYGILTETSIVQLFMAGILPGLLLATLIILYIIISVRIKPEIIDQLSKQKQTQNCADEIAGISARELIDEVVSIAQEGDIARKLDSNNGQALEKRVGVLTILPAIVLIFIVLGSMYTGFATPLEAAGYGVVGSLVLLIIQKRITKKIFFSVMSNTIRTGTMMIFLVICGFTLTHVVSYLGIAQSISRWIAGSGLNKYVVLLMLYALWFILGALMDPASMTILTIPFLFKTLMELGFDRIWLGVVMVLGAQIAMLTPPVGMNLFVLKANTDVPMADIISGTLPYILVLLLGLAILTIFPGISTLLPSLMF